MSNAVEQLRERVRRRDALPHPAARRAIRVAARATLAEVGEAVGVTAEAIRLWELGRREPGGRRLESYTAALAALQEELTDRGRRS